MIASILACGVAESRDDEIVYSTLAHTLESVLASAGPRVRTPGTWKILEESFEKREPLSIVGQVSGQMIIKYKGLKIVDAKNKSLKPIDISSEVVWDAASNNQNQILALCPKGNGAVLRLSSDLKTWSEIEAPEGVTSFFSIAFDDNRIVLASETRCYWRSIAHTDTWHEVGYDLYAKSLGYWSRESMMRDKKIILRGQRLVFNVYAQGICGAPGSIIELDITNGNIREISAGISAQDFSIAPDGTLWFITVGAHDSSTLSSIREGKRVCHVDITGAHKDPRILRNSSPNFERIFLRGNHDLLVASSDYGVFEYTTHGWKLITPNWPNGSTNCSGIASDDSGNILVVAGESLLVSIDKSGNCDTWLPLVF